MNKLFFAILVLVSSIGFAKSDEVAAREIPKEPIYLEASLYNVLKDRLPRPPVAKSSEQLADEKELLRFQTVRTKAECAYAGTEVHVGLGAFYAAILKPKFNDAQFEKLAAFFETIRNDADFFIQNMKVDFPRERPYNYIQGIAPCVALETTKSYPSGHATLSKLYANILIDMFPVEKSKFDARSAEIGKNRILSGLHHPSDITAGRKLADMIYAEYKKSKKFKVALDKLKAAIK